jgi:phosphate:Na+ symporter
VVFFPLLKPYAALLCRMLPTRTDPADPCVPLYLDPAARDNPAIALGGAAREALRLADMLAGMLVRLRESLEKADRRQISESRRQDDVLDKLNTSIKTYVTGLDTERLGDGDQIRLRQILTFTTNMQYAGDLIGRSLLGIANRMVKRGVTFSKAGQTDLLGMLDRLMANTRTAATIFMTGDERAARELAGEQEVFRNLEQTATDAHFARFRAGETESVETSSMHLGVLRDLKSINGYLVAAAAYPILERRGELLASRLRGPEEA